MLISVTGNFELEYGVLECIYCEELNKSFRKEETNWHLTHYKFVFQAQVTNCKKFLRKLFLILEGYKRAPKKKCLTHYHQFFTAFDDKRNFISKIKRRAAFKESLSKVWWCSWKSLVQSQAATKLSASKERKKISRQAKKNRNCGFQCEVQGIQI